MRIGITGPISEVNFGNYGILVNHLYIFGRECKLALSVLVFNEDKVTTIFDKQVCIK